MNVALRQQEFSSDSDPKIIKLYDYNYVGEMLRNYDIINLIIGNQSFEKYLKEFMEGLIFSNWLDKYSGYLDKQDNPFDSIYLADLKPDKLSKANKKMLITNSLKIEDRSSQILFNDGLDD